MPIDPQVENQFVAVFWRLAVGNDPSALRIAKYIRPEMIRTPPLRIVYAGLCDRLASGALQDDDATRFALAEAIGTGGLEIVVNLYDEAAETTHLRAEPYAREIFRWWQAGRISAHLSASAQEVAGLAADDPREAVKAAETALHRGLASLREFHPEAGPQTRREYAEAERAKMDAKGIIGASWPYPKMQRILGHLRPGKLYGISALPGVGKSTLLANLFGGFVRKGVPVIVAPTEMRDEWLSRAYAAAAGVPQEIAENALWDADDPEVVEHLAEVWELGRGTQARHVVEGNLRAFRERYEATIAEFERLPWEVIGGADLTVDEIIARAAILRRRFPGKFVLLAVDHMHNLAYPNGDTDKHVGAGAKRLREFMQDDTEGGMAGVVLFQPRKPEKNGGDQARFKPLPAQEVRGQVAQVLDVHMSIFHRRVRIDPSGKLNDWGAPATMLHPEHGYPMYARKEDDPADCKDDDEHIYIRPDKRRRHGGNRGNPTCILTINAETGAITERDTRRFLQVM